jgi:hypothetical protein
MRDHLPVGNYTVCRDPLTGEYYLEDSEPFVLPPKLYGKTSQWADRILSSFAAVTDGHQLGVLLSGEKGSGKTMLAKVLGVKSGLPVIIVNAPFTEDRFMRALQAIEQPALILFDEFEKLYNKDAQAQVLTLFDGVYTARNKLMVLTVNDRYAVREFFHNRPGRLRYAIDYKGLDATFIQEYCKDNLNNPDYLEDILKTSVGCGVLNFDMLQALVRELNTYGGTVEDTVEVLNVKPVSNGQDSVAFTVTPLVDNGFKFEPGTLNSSPMDFYQKHPGHAFSFIVSCSGKSSKGEDFTHAFRLPLTVSDMRMADPFKGSSVFEAVAEFEYDLDNDEEEKASVPVRVEFRTVRTPSFYQGGWTFGGLDV